MVILILLPQSSSLHSAPSYGPVPTTPLTRAMRADLNRLDQGTTSSRAREAEQAEAMIADRSCGQDLGNGWEIDWEGQALVKAHPWQKRRYWPTAKEAPIRHIWLTGRRHTLKFTAQDRECLETITDDGQVNGTDSLGEWWKGYTVLEFDGLPGFARQGDDGEIEVNEVTCKDILGGQVQGDEKSCLSIRQ